ncbi:MAG: PKD domain-containing protein [Flavobacteriales bacterium]
MGAVVCLREGPDGALWYVRYETGEIRKVSPLGVTNLPPIAVATQDRQYGPGPLTVRFDGTGSRDPEQGALTYAWAFGDGGTSTLASPTHVFTAPAGVPTRFDVQLTVTDPEGLSTSTSLLVSVNNTPPSVAIISFPDGQLYPVGVDTTIALAAHVTDAEHGPAQLSYAWRTFLHHNAHEHPESAIRTVTGTTVVSGEGCYTDTYYYEVQLTVTDAGGLSTTVSHDLFPRCTGIPPTAVITSDITQGEGPFTAHLSGMGSVDNGTIVSYVWAFGDGTFADGAEVEKTFTDPGDHYVTLTVRDNDGNTGSTTSLITVYDPLPPQCLGTMGALLREYWTGIGPGPAIADLTSNPLYPDLPQGSSLITSFQGPVNWGDDYGTRVRGYIIAPETGDYRFTVTGDDAVLLYISPNADPRFMRAVCSTPAYTGVAEFDRYPMQRSAAIPLIAGRYYYVELLHKEGFGDDHFSVWWERPSAPARAVITGQYLASWQRCSPSLGLRMVLQGPYVETDGLMRDALRNAGYLPLSEPFTAMGFDRAGAAGGETMDAQLLGVSGMNAVVDWVLVELRAAGDPRTVVATRACLLQRDGDVMDVTGRTMLLFDVPEGAYHVAVRHRNHLGVMSAEPLVLSAGAQRNIDLSSGFTATYGTNARAALGQGRWGLWSGDVLRDGILRYTGAENDRDPILVDIGGRVPTAVVRGYYSSDIDLDGLVKYTGAGNDRDPILRNVGGIVPTATRSEQLP